MLHFIYSALLTQTGPNPPELAQLNEGILGTTWARSAPGTYHFRRNKAFWNVETDYPQQPMVEILPNGEKITFAETAKHEITIQTFAAADLNTPVDGILNQYYFALEIPRNRMFL